MSVRTLLVKYVGSLLLDSSALFNKAYKLVENLQACR